MGNNDVLERLAALEARADMTDDQMADRVTRDRFGPVEKFVYGMAAVILTAVLLAALTVVLKP